MVNDAIAAMEEACRRLGRAISPQAFLVSVPGQTAVLIIRDEGSTYEPEKYFTISTSRFGAGQRQDSQQTPLGLHRIAEKFGGDLPSGAIFKGRKATGQLTSENPHADIAHRILWLDGLEPGHNLGGTVDSYSRYIYIHGVGDESGLGRPASQGCVHVGVDDLLPLYDRLPVDSLVWIGEFPLPREAIID